MDSAHLNGTLPTSEQTEAFEELHRQTFALDRLMAGIDPPNVYLDVAIKAADLPDNLAFNEEFTTQKLTLAQLATGVVAEPFCFRAYQVADAYLSLLYEESPLRGLISANDCGFAKTMI